MELFIQVVVPKNILNLVASTKPQNAVYKLSRDQIQQVVDLIHQASPNQIQIRLRPKNQQLIEDLARWNWLNPDKAVEPEEVVQSITVDNYANSFVGTTGADRGKEFHSFEGLSVPGFTRRSKEKIYVKLITPEENQPIDVVSFHRSIDRG